MNNAPPPYPGMPRWAKVFGVVALTLGALFVTVHLMGGGFRHHGFADHGAESAASDGGTR